MGPGSAGSEIGTDSLTAYSPRIVDCINAPFFAKGAKGGATRHPPVHVETIEGELAMEKVALTESREIKTLDWKTTARLVLL